MFSYCGAAERNRTPVLEVEALCIIRYTTATDHNPTNLTQIVQITSLSKSRTSRPVRSQIPQ